MDGEHSNAYAEWQKMGSSGLPTTQQFIELQRAGKLEAIAPEAAITTKGGTARLPIKLERQGVMLVRFSW